MGFGALVSQPASARAMTSTPASIPVLGVPAFFMVFSELYLVDFPVAPGFKAQRPEHLSDLPAQA